MFSKFAYYLRGAFKNAGGADEGFQTLRLFFIIIIMIII